MKLFTKNTPMGKLAGFLVAALLLTGCFAESPSGPDSTGSGKDVTLKIRMGLGKVNALGKTSTITLQKVRVVFSSSATDTVRDSMTTLTSPALNPVSTTGQTLVKAYTLTALRTWKIMVTSLDMNNVVIHRDSSVIPALYAGDTAFVNLNLSAKYTMYEANFLTLPDFIESATPAQPTQNLQISRLVLKIDGITVRDSTSALAVIPKDFFDSLATHTLAYDYVAVGSHLVEMIAYGKMNYWNNEAPGILFSGSTTINVGAGIDQTVPLTLTWMGPMTGAGKLNVTIGKVGKVIVNGTLPGTPFP